MLCRMHNFDQHYPIFPDFCKFEPTLAQILEIIEKIHIHVHQSAFLNGSLLYQKVDFMTNVGNTSLSTGSVL